MESRRRGQPSHAVCPIFFQHNTDSLPFFRTRHLPKSVRQETKLNRTMVEAQRVKEERRRKHTRAGESKPKAEKKKAVIVEQTWPTSMTWYSKNHTKMRHQMNLRDDELAIGIKSKLNIDSRPPFDTYMKVFYVTKSTNPPWTLGNKDHGFLGTDENHGCIALTIEIGLWLTTGIGPRDCAMNPHLQAVYLILK